MNICITRIQQAHPNVDPNIIEDIVNDIASTKRLNNQSMQTIMAKYGATETLMRNIRKEIQEEITLSKVMDLKMRAENAVYKAKGGTDKFITDLFATSLDNVQGSALSISALKEQYARKYNHSLDMALLDIDKRSISMIKTMDVNESAQLLKAINGQTTGDAVIDSIGAAIKTANDSLYADKAPKGFMVTYRDNYGFRRFYDGDKLQQAGLAKFSSDILNDLDLTKSKIEGVTQGNVKEILDLINRNASDDEFLKAAKTNELLGAIKDDMDNWVAEYDPYDIGTSSKLYASTGRQSSRKQRSYIFKNENTEMNFMKENNIVS